MIHVPGRFPQQSWLDIEPEVAPRDRRIRAPPLYPDMAELRLDVFHDAVVGRGRGAQNRHIVGHEPQDVDQTAVVGSEIMTPIRNAVCLIHHQKPDATGNGQEHVFAS